MRVKKRKREKKRRQGRDREKLKWNEMGNKIQGENAKAEAAAAEVNRCKS